MRFLIIDDNPYDRELIIRKLRTEFSDVDYVEISQQADFDRIIAQEDIDAVLVDYFLKWTTGLDILKKLRVRFPDLPVVMVTDTGNEEVAAEGMKAGLSDYVLKRHLQRLPHALQESLRKVIHQKEHRELEEQIRQAQKMESLGLLVSGITHDFNNLLAGIAGYAQLAFSRRHVIDPHQINLNKVIARLLDLLSKMIPGNIEVEFVPEQNLEEIMGDTVQIEQVLMNLCINACDAMPNGGKILLRTQNIYVDEHQAELLIGVQPGWFVHLSIADTGTGMDEQIQARAFEPFFTTKESNKGTGLGLSVVHGIVEQHHGFITLESQKGVGTTFKLYFPVINQVAIQAEAEEVNGAQGGMETILLVEDDPDVGALMVEVLQSYGYTVILARDGIEGLELFKQHVASIALVITDLMMPRMKGRELYDHVHRFSPTTGFLFVSGYRADQLDQGLAMEKKVQFLEKPFDLDRLMAAVHRALTRDGGAAERFPG